MIRFTLRCTNYHEFDGWFASNDDFENQKKRNLITCPTCSCSEIVKQPMAPMIMVKNDKKATGFGDVDNKKKSHIKRMRAFRNMLIKNGENVGDNFAEEARKIYYGEASQREIYGKVTLETANSLVEEGISILPLPELPEDKN